VTDGNEYVIRGGIDGRERLRVLARVMRPSTASLLDRVGVSPGMICLDAGCGGGDVTVDLARRIAPGGRVVGVDTDETTLELARQEAAADGIDNVEFRALDIRTERGGSGFDLVYARFLLTHLRDPASTVSTLFEHVLPGGMMAVEDIDFSGGFTWPESEAYQRHAELYCAVVRNRGGDPDIGKRLPLLLAAGGLEDIEMHVVQPIGIEGEVKLLNPITMENIADAVVRDGLASRAEVEAIARELYRVAADPGIVAGLPRIVQVWGRRPGP
jgi:SAM-dependent methyltransferase